MSDVQDEQNTATRADVLAMLERIRRDIAMAIEAVKEGAHTDVPAPPDTNTVDLAGEMSAELSAIFGDEGQATAECHGRENNFAP